jgi:hypothetical protein
VHQSLEYGSLGMAEGESDALCHSAVFQWVGADRLRRGPWSWRRLATEQAGERQAKSVPIGAVRDIPRSGRDAALRNGGEDAEDSLQCIPRLDPTQADGRGRGARHAEVPMQGVTRLWIDPQAYVARDAVQMQCAAVVDDHRHLGAERCQRRVVRECRAQIHRQRAQIGVLWGLQTQQGRRQHRRAVRSQSEFEDGPSKKGSR